MSASLSRRIGHAVWGPALAVSGAIFTASHTSAPPLIGSVPDYFAHMGVYALLSVAVLHGLQRGVWRRRVTLTQVLVAVLVSAAYGMTDEYHQAFVPGRTPSFVDVASDLAGGVAGAGGAWVWSIVLAGRRGRFPHLP